NPATLAATGGNQPHNNMPPYQVLMFIIALQGIFPSRS
ncbi:MAG TPA: phage tail protein, partial [Verrucomicrobiae bacterium]|nr:phage tail protein [Verrucomicrobiae bacterium]